jgi:peptidoglycan/LPS O-acetylase OafA/YrhL
LDGIRALAVVAVVLFHSSLGIVPGGFLGVEVFFVISGFIITAGLAREFSTAGGIRLTEFWKRRALRLLPAVVLLIVAVLAYGEVFAHDSLANLRNDSAAALLYVTNWYLIADGQSYFGGFAEPSLLKHLWSLAIEEQFYVVWPPLILGGLLLMRRRLLGALLLLCALGSAALMAGLFEGGADVSRLYYGTDTRASGLLVGAALALCWTPGPSALTGRRRWALDLAGAAALGALVLFCLVLSDSSAALYRGGFLAVDLATAVLLVASVVPATRVAMLLGAAPLRWVGVRSYGLYLWHWPILLIVAPEPGWMGGAYAVFGLQVALTGVIAAASYRWLETPIRRLGFRGTFDAIRRRVHAPFALRLARSAAVAGAISAAAIVIGFAATAPAPEEPDYFRLESIRVVSAPRATATPNAEVSGVSYGASDNADGAIDPSSVEGFVRLGEALNGQIAEVVSRPTGDGGTSGAAETTTNPAPLPTPGPALDVRVTAVGDSVMLGAANQLASAIAGIDVDAVVSRSMDNAIGVLQSRYESGTLADVVLLHVGNNGPIHDEQMERIAALVGEGRTVLFLSLRVPRNWEEGNNDVLARAVARHANFELLDWRTASGDRPEVMWKDGIHLRPEGATYYAALVQAALALD